MAMYIDSEGVIFEESGDENKKEVLGSIGRISQCGEPPTVTMDQEKRMRREIANSNERRRMQSINNGFQSLRSLLPHHEGEKLSKAAILQQTAEYIYSLEQEKTRLLSQNCQLKRLVGQHEGGELPPKKRKTELIIPAIESADDEGLDSLSPEQQPVKLITLTVANESPSELKKSLDRERNMRLLLEDQVRQLEQQLYQHQSAAESQIQYITEETEDIGLQLVAAESVPPVANIQTVVCSTPPSRDASPERTAVAAAVVAEEERLPSVLKAAIKAEPKVEVERLPSPAHDEISSGNLYSVSNTSRQNLETIVEAIRHLEGDHMFGDDSTVGASVTVTTSPEEPQDIPLALTTRDSYHVEYSAATLQQHQQSRPGVIVVKQAS